MSDTSPLAAGWFIVRIYPIKTNHSGWKTLIKPSKKSVLKIRKRLRDEWLKLQGQPIAAVIKRLNPITRGWANYFRTQVSTATFHSLDNQMYFREVRYAKHTHPHKSRQWQVAKYWGKLNPNRMDNWVFGDKETGAYLLKFKWTGIRRHTMVTGRNSPDDATLTKYWQQRNLNKTRDLTPKLRALAKRQDGKCPICGESLFIEENVEQHHIVRRDEDGPNSIDNLMLLHLYCHQQLTAFQNRKP